MGGRDVPGRGLVPVAPPRTMIRRLFFGKGSAGPDTADWWKQAERDRSHYRRHRRHGAPRGAGRRRPGRARAAGRNDRRPRGARVPARRGRLACGADAASGRRGRHLPCHRPRHDDRQYRRARDAVPDLGAGGADAWPDAVVGVASRQARAHGTRHRDRRFWNRGSGGRPMQFVRRRSWRHPPGYAPASSGNPPG